MHLRNFVNLDVRDASQVIHTVCGILCPYPRGVGRLRPRISAPVERGCRYQRCGELCPMPLAIVKVSCDTSSLKYLVDQSTPFVSGCSAFGDSETYLRLELSYTVNLILWERINHRVQWGYREHTTRRVSRVIFASKIGTPTSFPVSFFWLSSEKCPFDSSLCTSREPKPSLKWNNGTHLIFLRMIPKSFWSPLLASRRFLSARVETRIRHSPKPSTESKWKAAFIGWISGYAAGISACNSDTVTDTTVLFAPLLVSR